MSAAIPLTVLTGFLGSGKTTLLNHLLAQPSLADSAVLINEYGDVAIDHLLVEKIDDTIMLLQSGCLCCTVRGDLVTALRDLFLKRVQGAVPEFSRLIIETTGLADPAPIIHTLMRDPLSAARYCLDGIVATIDAVNGLSQLDSFDEPVKQAAMADRLLLTKCDLASAEQRHALEQRLRQLNPAAPQIEVEHGHIAPEQLVNLGLFSTDRKHPDVAGWLRTEAYGQSHDEHRHHPHVSAFCLSFDCPLSWPRLAEAMELLLATNGERVLRVKGVIHVEDAEHPIALHGVQHVFHPPVAVPLWQSRTNAGEAAQRSHLVFITRDLSRNAVERLLHKILFADQTDNR